MSNEQLKDVLAFWQKELSGHSHKPRLQSFLNGLGAFQQLIQNRHTHHFHAIMLV